MGTEEVEDTYVSTAARMTLMTVPVLVSSIPVLTTSGDTRKVMASTVGTGVPETPPVSPGQLPVGRSLPPGCVPVL